MVFQRLGSWAGLVVMAGVICCAAPAWGDEGLALLDQATINALRERGPEGLVRVIAAYERLNLDANISVAESELAAATSLLNPVDTTPEREANAAERRARLERLRSQQSQLRAAIDQIGGQRSCTVSRLYWYTDLDRPRPKRGGRAGRFCTCGCSAS